jgi:tRNA splicing endonuclease
MSLRAICDDVEFRLESVINAVRVAGGDEKRVKAVQSSP